MSSRLQAEIKQTKPFARPSDEALVSILRTATVLEHGSNEVLRPFGITMTQYNVLRILRGAGHLVERRTRRGHDRGRDRTLDEWGVDKPEMTVAVAAEDFTDSEDRAAEVTEQEDALALVGLRHGLTDEGLRGSEASVGPATGRLYVHVRPGHLTGQQLQSRCQLGAV